MSITQVSPKFSLDFTSATLSPLVTFARSGNTATRINSAGFVESVLADVARFDYDPITLACRGLLIEDQRTNLLTYSENFANAIWGKSAAASVTSNTVTGPDNTLSGDTLTFTAGAATVNQEVTVSNGSTYTLSVWLRCASGTVSIELGSINVGVFETKTVTTTWQRFTVTQAASSGTRFPAIRSTAASTIYAWGAQLELGASVTSYIPNVATGTTTRNADVATITGTAFSGFWRSGPGSTLVRALPSTVSGTRPLVQVDDATADNIIALRGNTTNPELYIREGGADQATIDAGTISAAAYRLAGAWQAGSAAASLNSGLAVNGAPASIPAATQMRLGSDGTNYLNGHLQAVQYWDSKLSNTTLRMASSTAGRRSLLKPIITPII